MEKLLNVKQLSELIGVSPKTIYQWTHTEFIPHYKFSKGVRFSVMEVEKWIINRRIKGRNTYSIEI